MNHTVPEKQLAYAIPIHYFPVTVTKTRVKLRCPYCDEIMTVDVPDKYPSPFKCSNCNKDLVL